MNEAFMSNTSKSQEKMTLILLQSCQLHWHTLITFLYKELDNIFFNDISVL